MTARSSSWPGVRPPALALLAAIALFRPAAGAEAQAGSPAAPPADPNAPPHAGIERIEVEGEGEAAGEAPTSFVTVILPDAFAWRAATLADLLDETPGVRVRSFGGLHAFATASIRGSTAQQVGVFVDGVPVASALGGAANLADLPLAGVAAIEIHRGFTPSSVGPGSIGGAINLRTSRPGGERSGSASVSYGSLDTFGAAGASSFRTGGVSWTASAEGSGTEGDFEYLDNNGTILTTVDDRQARRGNNASWSAAARLRGEGTAAGGARVAVSGEWLRRRQGIPGIDANPSLDATYGLQRWLARAESAWDGLARGAVDVAASIDASRTSSLFDDPPGRGNVAGLPRETLLHETGAGAQLRIVARPAAPHRLAFLLEPRLQEARSIERAGASGDPIRATRGSLSAVLEDEIRIASGRALLAPALRWEIFDETSRGGPPSAEGGRERHAAATGRLGLLVPLTARWSLRVNAGNAHRPPTLLERFGDEGSIEGNPSLRPERGASADAGLSLHGGAAGALRDVGMEIAAFRTDTEDLIQFVPTATRTLKAVNVARARVTGVEASLSMRIGRRLHASASATIQKPRDLGGTFASGGDLVLRPRRQADTSLSLDLGRASLFHRFAYVGPNDASAVGGIALPSGRQGAVRLPARYLHDAGVRLRFSPRVGATLEVVNLLDRHVVDVARYPLPGRLVSARVTAAF